MSLAPRPPKPPGDPNNEILGSLLLRTSTPAPDEKVLVYLEKMRESYAHSTDAGDDPGTTLKSPRSRGSNLPKSQLSGSSWRRDANGGYRQDGEEDEDAASDVQENAQSTLGSLVQRNGVHREPGPEDEPGPHYESYGSSWGNFGPLPPDSAFGESTPGKAAGIPLPNSAGPPSTKVRSSRAGSRASASQQPQSAISRTRATEKEAVTAFEDVASAKLGSSTTHVNGNARAVPTRSYASPTPSGRTRGSEKPSTVYPPLPPSPFDQGSSSQLRPASAQRSHSRAPSLSPSDSPSQMKAYRKAAKSIGKEPSLAPVPQSANPSEVEGDSRNARSQRNGDARSQGPSVMSNGNSRQQRPFSPYRNAPTDQDLLHAAIHGQMDSQRQMNVSPTKTRSQRDLEPGTPQSSHLQSDLNPDEEEMVQEILSRVGKTPRTSYAATSVLEPTQFSHYHDMDLCILLHQLDDPMQHEVVKKAVRKAVKARIKQLGMKYDNETIKQYRKSFHDHDPSVHLQADYQPNVPEEPPEWAKEFLQRVNLIQQRVEALGPKIDGLKTSQAGSSLDDRRYYTRQQAPPSELYTQTPQTQTVNIQTHPTGTVGDESMYQPPDADMRIVESTHGQTLPGSMHHHDGSAHGMTDEEYEDEEGTETGHRPYRPTSTQGDTHTRGISEYTGNRDSPGQQYLEEELYKLRVRPGGSQSGVSHKTWELAKDDGDGDGEYDDNPDAREAVTESGMPEIPDSNAGGYADRRATSPPLPPLPSDDDHRDVAISSGQVWQQQQQQPSEYSEPPQPPAWQRIHQRLLNWAIVWPLTELDTALNSTTRGNQVDEVALSIWSTQTYKRYVRSKMTDSPPGRVDRLFVPPNMADAISNAVFNGRHGDASGMLRELWHPFGLEGMPRLLIVLAKHRSDANHWVVHRFSLPDGTLTTYDSYPERCLPDGRPLGWWFAIRIAWPNAIYPSPDHLMQKMVRLHRPMQLGIDNSVAAAGIWRNLLMGSRAERSLDLERLRDLINTEVKNLRQRKLMGKLSIGAPRPNWEDMH